MSKFNMHSANPNEIFGFPDIPLESLTSSSSQKVDWPTIIICTVLVIGGVSVICWYHKKQNEKLLAHLAFISRGEGEIKINNEVRDKKKLVITKAFVK